MIEIGYLSFDASVKIHYSGKYTSTKTSKTGYGGIAGYIRHLDRGTDKMNGCEVHHNNPDINSDLTLQNESYYKDSNGKWQKTSHSKDMIDAINRHIEYAKEHEARISTKRKNDTVIVHPLVVQLDSETISQTRFFQNPKQLAGLHKKFRKALLDKGNDIEQENKPLEEQIFT